MKRHLSYLKAATVAGLMGACSLHATYTGLTVGYLVDSEDTLIAGHIGTDIKKTESFVHGIEFEVGYISESEMGIDVDINPFMVNYRIVNISPEKYDLFGGLGAGFSLVDVGGHGFSDDDEVLTVQLFFGGEYHLTEQLGLRLGYRYLWLDDFELFGFDLEDADDHVIEVGLSYLF